MGGWHLKEVTITNDQLHQHLAVAAPLADPAQLARQLGHPQSLSKGATGMALIHIENALAGRGDWHVAHQWLKVACARPIAAGSDATLYFGAPALAFTLHTAEYQGNYRRALAYLDSKITSLVRRRLDRAHARIDRNTRPALAEFDLINGLTGLGAHLLRRDPHGELVRDVLAYLVRLTQPLGDLPGWWSDQPPTGKRTNHQPGGHANHGMAHGITGPLALLALGKQRGVTVDGHEQAIGRICDWLDHWRQDHDAGPWWPEVLTVDDLHRGRPTQTTPLRPSWCYGTPGIARAQQLAGQALADPDRQRLAEQALLGCLTDPGQQRRIIDRSLCHGVAGLFQSTWRITADAAQPHRLELVTHLRRLGQRLHATRPDGAHVGFLEGATGLALATATAATDTAPASGWDASLLLH